MKWPRVKIVWGDEPPPGGQLDEDAVAAPPPAKRPRWQRVLGWHKQTERPRPFLVRLFALKIGSAINLSIWCVVVGAVIQLTQFNPLSPDFNAAETAGGLGSQAWAAASWLVKMGWRPAITGATLVLPIWFAWRVITLPFRR